MAMKISLQRALLLLSGGALLAALVPAGLALDRRLTAELEADAVKDLAMAPPLLADRQASQAEALRMHAREVASHPGLVRALEERDIDAAAAELMQMVLAPSEAPVLAGPRGTFWIGSEDSGDPTELADAGEQHPAAPEWLDSEDPMLVPTRSGRVYRVALAPVERDGSRFGVAGVAVPLDLQAAQILAGLTLSEVILVGPSDEVLATTLDPEVAAALIAQTRAGAVGEVSRASVGGEGEHDREEYWAVASRIGSETAGLRGRAIFARSVATELAALPRLRRGALLAAALVLGLSLAIGTLLARNVARPVRALAHASGRLAEGDFEAPLPRSRLTEVDRVSRAFAEMREALAARLAELRAANRELANRQERLTQLQAELVQRDRLVAAGRLVTELAHEIRNPVANVRNCLEVVRRHVSDAKAREFTDLAVEELLRMHELAERMLDLNRPVGDGPARCDPVAVAGEVAALAELGDRAGRWPISVVTGPPETEASIPPESLKQVLLALATNAREAMPDGGAIEIRIGAEDGRTTIDVCDEGSGFDADTLPYVLDPFFTTKSEVHGVGIGLFIADGVLRRHGGRIRAENRVDRSGARVRIDLPVAHVGDAAS